MNLLFLFLSAAFASTLSVDFKTKDIAVKGEFTFKPGNIVTISGSDASGKPYVLGVMTSVLKDDTGQFVYHLKHVDEKPLSGSVITKKGKLASLTSGTKGEPPSTEFKANWLD